MATQFGTTHAKRHIKKHFYHFITLILYTVSCTHPQPQKLFYPTDIPVNTLDYRGTPTLAKDRSSLAFSDQGAWFAYGFPSSPKYHGGFSGPFLMTQENGVWSSKVLSQLELLDSKSNKFVDWTNFEVSQTSYNSHLEQAYQSEDLKVSQILFFLSRHTAIKATQITNISNQTIELEPAWKGKIFPDGLRLEQESKAVVLRSTKSTAKGTIQTFESAVRNTLVTDSTYQIKLEKIELQPGEIQQLVITQSFSFNEEISELDPLFLSEVAKELNNFLQMRKKEKENQLQKLFNKMDTTWKSTVYKDLVAKASLTLQNNWRAPAGELKHSGVFPSYHYLWFHGFWAWDSWKHAVALAHYDPQLATEQIEAMYYYLTEDGFIPDCIFRDTTIEKHNYRNTKPPLSAWAVWKIYEQDRNDSTLKSLYPKIVKQHNWWYTNRDHDKDSLCEYGSTDGTLIAAKWESGMDNAVRFDNSKILKNSTNAYSLDQESVDLNAYLYAEKMYLIEMARVLNRKEDQGKFEADAIILKAKIQDQFFDPSTGWYYDTSLDGKTFIKAKGCEGWIPLWAEVATQDQANAVKNSMMNPGHFNTKVPFQTLSASHPKFKPDGGYWRGPNWLDQAYFGVQGLHNYGFHEEAYEATYKLIHNAEGVLAKGNSIRENYHPITGEGLESENFSWSAAHYLLLLINE